MERMRRVVDCLAAHGFSDIAVKLDPGVKPSRDKSGEAQTANSSERLKQTLAELGGIYVFAAKYLSARKDLLPQEYADALATIEYKPDPIKPDCLKNLLVESLGAEPQNVFSEWDPQPQSADIVSQTHRAVTKDGREITLRVRRPGVAGNFFRDMEIIKKILKAIAENMPALSFLGEDSLHQKISQATEYELDFLAHASHISQFAWGISSESMFRSPIIHWDYMTENTLALECGKCSALTEHASAALSGAGNNKTAKAICRILIRPYFTGGLHIADPSPASILMARGGILSFGGGVRFARIDSETRKIIARAMNTITEGDESAFVDLLQEIGGEQNGFQAFASDVRKMFDRYRGIPMRRISEESLLCEMLELARKHGIRLPAELVRCASGIAKAAGLARSFSPDIALGEISKSYFRKILGSSLDPRPALKNLGERLQGIFKSVTHAPENLRDFIKSFFDGQLQLTINHKGFDYPADKFERSTSIFSLALVIVATVIGASAVLAIGSRHTGGELTQSLPGVSFVGIVASCGFVVAIGMGLWLAWKILKEKKKQ